LRHDRLGPSSPKKIRPKEIVNCRKGIGRAKGVVEENFSALAEASRPLI
jgi:hypothetical protein